MVTKYSPVRLPVRLDNTRMETREQLSARPENISKIEEACFNKEVQLRENLSRACSEIVERDIRRFLEEPMHSTVSLDSRFDFWLRTFHTEYDDSWFSANHQRLVRSFKPVWDDVVAKVAGGSSTLRSAPSGLLKSSHELGTSVLSSVDLLPDLLGY
jgi:hypothetical protein